MAHYEIIINISNESNWKFHLTSCWWWFKFKRNINCCGIPYTIHNVQKHTILFEWDNIILGRIYNCSQTISINVIILFVSKALNSQFSINNLFMCSIILNCTNSDPEFLFACYLFNLLNEKVKYHDKKKYMC